MKKQIRKGVFETNSSSVHAIAIANDVNNEKLEYPNTVKFEYGEFGWGFSILDTVYQKASYLYTSMFYHINIYDSSSIEKWRGWLQFIVDTLADHGVECEFDDGIEIKIYGEYRHEISISLDLYNYYHVDHGNETKEFVEAVCSDKNLLLSYLFSPKSFVMTGNDNSDTVPHINVDYAHVEFEKRN